MEQENIQDRNIHNANAYYEAYTKPRLTNIWTPNLGFQKCNETGYFIIDSIRTRECMNEKSVKIRIPKRRSQRFIKHRDIFKVRLKRYNVVLKYIVNVEYYYSNRVAYNIIEKHLTM